MLAHREGVLFLPEWVATDSGLFHQSQKLCPAQRSLLHSACFSWFWRTLPIRTRGGKRSLLLLCASGPQSHPGFESSHFIQPFSDVCVECAVLHLPGTRQGGLTETTSIGKKMASAFFFVRLTPSSFILCVAALIPFATSQLCSLSSHYCKSLSRRTAN